MALRPEEKRARRLERLQKKADELGITVEEFKEQKKNDRVDRLAKKAKEAGMSLREFRKQLKEERKQKRVDEMKEELERRRKRREEGPVKTVTEVLVPAGVPVKKSKDTIGDFIKRNKEKGIGYMKVLAGGCWGFNSKKTQEIEERLKKEFGEKAVDEAKYEPIQKKKTVGDKPKKAEAKKTVAKPKKVKGKIVRKKAVTKKKINWKKK